MGPSGARGAPPQLTNGSPSPAPPPRMPRPPLPHPHANAQMAKPAGIKGLPQLPARVVKVQAAAADSSKPVLAAAEEKKFLGVSTFTWQKIIPLGLMFFW